MRNSWNLVHTAIIRELGIAGIIRRCFPGRSYPGTKTTAVSVPRLTKTEEYIYLSIKTGDNQKFPIPKIAVIVVAAYIAAQMLADIASLKIGVVAGMAVDMGTFIYPITFTLRDLVHKVLGKRNTRVLIIAAGVINLFMSLYLNGQPVYPAIRSGDWKLNSLPCWPRYGGSCWLRSLPKLVAELLDTEIYHWFVTKITEKHQWATGAGLQLGECAGG